MIRSIVNHLVSRSLSMSTEEAHNNLMDERSRLRATVDLLVGDAVEMTKQANGHKSEAATSLPSQWPHVFC